MAISHVFTNAIPDGTNTNIVRPSDWNSAHNQYYTLSGNTLGASTVSGTNVVLQGAGNVSLSGTGGTIVVYGTGGGVAVSAGTQSASSGTVILSNSNGVSFGLNNGTLTASVPSVSALSNGNNITISNTGSNVGISAQAVAVGAGTQTATSGTVNFVNSNGVTFGMSGSNQITASVAAAGGAGNFNLSGATSGDTTATGSTINLSGINITLSGTNGSQIAISAPATSSLSAGNNISISSNGSTIGLSALAIGLNTAGTNVTWTANSSGLSINAAGYAGTGTSATNASVTLNSNGLAISVAAPGGGGGGAALSAGTQSVSTGTVNFANSNGISFGMSGSNQITASYTVPTVPTSYVSNVNGSSGQISLNVGSSLSSSTNGSSITFGLASNITTALQSANANYLTSQSNQAFSASGGSSTFQTLNFANSNGVTFSNSGGSVVASYTVPTVPTAYVSSVNGSSGAISLNVASSLSSSVNGSSITFGLASNITTALQSTGNYLTTARASNDAVGLNTAATNVTWTVNSSGISLDAVGYAGTGTSATNASITLNSAGLAISVAAPGGGGAMYANLSGATSGNTTASGNTLNFSGINITLSGTNNSQIAISAPATSSIVGVNGISIATAGSTVSISNAQYTLSGYNHYNDVVMSAGTVGQGALIFDHIDLENAVQFDRYGMLILNTNSSNSSGSHTISFWVGLYTLTGSSISLLNSTSTSVNVSQSGTVGSYSLYSGIRQLTIPFTTTLPQGEYYLGVVSRSTSSGSNGSYSQMRQSNFNSDYRGLWGSAVNATNQVFPGMGLYSATTSGLPGSVAFSQINGTNADAFRPPVVIFQSGTY